MIEYEIAKRMIIGDIHIDKRGILREFAQSFCEHGCGLDGRNTAVFGIPKNSPRRIRRK